MKTKKTMGWSGEAFDGLIQFISGKAKVPKVFVSHDQPDQRLRWVT